MHTFAADNPPAPKARASLSTAYQLNFANCNTTTTTSVARILNIELLAVSDATAQWITTQQPVIQVDCDTRHIHVHVTESRSGRYGGQYIAKDSGFQSDPGRFVALTIIELFAAQANSSPSAPSMAKIPRIRVTIKPGKLMQQTVRPLPRHRLQLCFSLLGGQKPFAVMPGAGIRYSFFQHFHLGLLADAQYHAADKNVSQGAIRSRYMTGAVYGVAWFKHRAGIVSMGPGFRAGALHYTGAADESERVAASRNSGPFGGPVVALQTIFLLPHFSIALALEGGYTIWEVGAIVEEEVTVSQTGFWTIATVGVGVTL